VYKNSRSHRDYNSQIMDMSQWLYPNYVIINSFSYLPSSWAKQMMMTDVSSSLSFSIKTADLTYNK
ncbi:MAG TPA: hypothetical protein VE619_05415, partial [Nitrososphaeraceae archaeon]|nr:hypothetical protein [Nitrososphaeraceae archaeon]